MYGPQKIYVFDYGAKNIPKSGRGEDTFYVNDNMLIVCDGVGSWKDKGYNAGKYAMTLITHMVDLYLAHTEFFTENPKTLIEKGVSLTKEIGSTTVTVLTLHPYTGQMKAAHLGDSVYKLFRKNGEGGSTIIYQGTQTQTEFNCPYQVGTYGNCPSLAVVKVFPNPKLHDMVVVASDGLWDNVFDDNICAEVVRQSNPTEMANTLASIAKQNSTMSTFCSPFYMKALQHNKQMPMGGKPDDITVIVAKIVLVDC